MIKIKYFVAKIISANWFGNFLGVVYGNKMKWNGVRINVANPIIKGRIKAYLFWGLYESAEARMIAKYVPAMNLPIVELGASIGAVSCLINRNKSKNIKSFHIEADKRFIPIILDNLARNNASDYVVEQKIIGSKGYSFQIGATNTVGKLVYDAGNTTECSSLGDILTAHSINKYYLISDIEGAEAFFIVNDSKDLANCEGMIIELHEIKVNEKVYSVRDLKDEIVRQGFTIREDNGANIYAVKG